MQMNSLTFTFFMHMNIFKTIWKKDEGINQNFKVKPLIFDIICPYANELFLTDVENHVNS